MSLQAVLLPLFVEVILTFALMLRMGALRAADFRSGAVKPADVALREAVWPKRTAQTANSFSNQFELPVLFYALTILEWVTGTRDTSLDSRLDLRPLPSATGLRARDQQHLSAAQQLLFGGRGCAHDHVGDLYRRGIDRGGCLIASATLAPTMAQRLSRR
jgi:hypothetical protein